ncbi:MAG: hypothetical protein K5879_01260 [Lachnospiraceae bacterium]|nr:hypothetical protein [Lachnospiraceae bacterium]
MTNTIDKLKCEKEVLEYVEFVACVEREYPRPYYYFDEDGKYAKRYVKANPGASIHEDTQIGNVLCKDNNSRLMYAYELLGASRAYAYISGNLFTEAMKAEAESVCIINELLPKEGKDAGRT